MTLIAAMDCGDSLLMGSDGLVTLEDRSRVRKRKLWVREEPPLVFGFSGGEGVGYRFRDWLLGCPIPTDMRWSGFALDATKQLSALNGFRVAVAKQSGASQPTAADLATFLIAGSIGGSLDVWELTFRGDMTSVKDYGFFGIGAGYTHALGAYAAMTSWLDKPRDLATMATCMEVSAEHAPMCGRPISLYRVSAAGVVEMQRNKGGEWHEPS